MFLVYNVLEMNYCHIYMVCGSNYWTEYIELIDSDDEVLVVMAEQLGIHNIDY